MILTNFSDNDKGVSPVIGVILMVAITVILSAVIGLAVTDIGGNVNENAQAGVDVQQTSEGVTVNWISSQNADSITVLVNGEDPSPDSVNNTLQSVGQSLTVQTEEGDTVSVVGATEDGTESTIRSEPATQKTLPSGETEPKVTQSSTNPTTVSLVNYDADYDWTTGTYDSTNTNTEVRTVAGEERLHIEGGDWMATQTVDVSSYDTIEVTANVTSHTADAGWGVFNSSDGSKIFANDPNNDYLGSTGKTTQVVDVSSVDTIYVGVRGGGVGGDANLTVSEIEVTAEE